MRIEQKLADSSERLARAERELQIAGEQLAFQTDVAEEARNRMLVSETPLADREYREARDDLERMRRHYEQIRLAIPEIRREQDRLLDRLIERSRGR